MIRVIAIDDHPLILSAISEELGKHPDIELVGTGLHGSKLFELVAELDPDVVILDLIMEKGGFEPVSAVRELLQSRPETTILILTADTSSIYMRRLLEAGAKGYLLKSDALSSSLPEAIRRLAAGEKYHSSTVVQTLLVNSPGQPLSEQEMDIIRLIAQGLDNSAIAKVMAVSDKRVRNIISIIYDKLGIPEKGDGINQRTMLLKKAKEYGWLEKTEVVLE
ncbi:MAG: response regulator [Chloroflexota bacterium]